MEIAQDFRMYVGLSFGLVKDRDGTVAGALAIGRDCTVAYGTEKDLRARVAELEGQLKIAGRQN